MTRAKFVNPQFQESLTVHQVETGMYVDVEVPGQAAAVFIPQPRDVPDLALAILGADTTGWDNSSDEEVATAAMNAPSVDALVDGARMHLFAAIRRRAYDAALAAAREATAPVESHELVVAERDALREAVVGYRGVADERDRLRNIVQAIAGAIIAPDAIKDSVAENIEAVVQNVPGCKGCGN